MRRRSSPASRPRSSCATCRRSPRSEWRRTRPSSSRCPWTCSRACPNSSQRMHELPMMEAALFQLRAALDGDDPLQLAACLLEGAIVAAKEQGLNAARVNDIEFALNDLAAEAPVSADATIALLREDLAALQRATALPAEVIAAIRALQAKLKTRAKAIERSQSRANSPKPDSRRRRSTDWSPIPSRCAITRSMRSSTSWM